MGLFCRDDDGENNKYGDRFYQRTQNLIEMQTFNLIVTARYKAGLPSLKIAIVEVTSVTLYSLSDHLSVRVLHYHGHEERLFLEVVVRLFEYWLL